MLFDKSDSYPESVYLLRLEQGPLAVSGARPFWIISEAGLTVGRAPDCTISLADEARLISRVQARVALIQGNAVWQQLGANPSWVNEVPLEKGSQKILKINDVIRLDPYVFQVALRAPSGAVGVIPEDWNPMELPAAPVEMPSKDFMPNQFKEDNLNRILQHTEDVASEESKSPESTLFAEASTIDELLGSGPSSSVTSTSTATAPVWMDELHARHGFSVTTDSVVQPVVPMDESIRESISGSINESTSKPTEQPQGIADFESRFLEGLGLSAWMIKQAHQVSPDFAYEMGLSYRKALEGMMAMMSARTLLKNQMHAEHTTLVPRDNNPLKSCPNVDDLFVRWFAGVNDSYLKPTQTIEATTQDLLEQQRATALALRMVIGRMAESFDPDALISKTEETSAAWDFRKYKARWEAHVEAYRSIFGHAADPVSALLSDAFRHAFEQYTKGTQS